MKIELYTKTGCFYCNQAKTLLKEHNHQYDEFIVGETIDRDEVISRFPNQRTLPIVVIDGELIGSWSELLDWKFPPMKDDSND